MGKVLILDFDLTLLREHSKGNGFVKDELDNQKIWVVENGKSIHIARLIDPKLLHLVLTLAKAKGWEIRIATNHGALGKQIDKVGEQTVSHNNNGPAVKGGAPAIQLLLDTLLPSNRTYLTDASHIIAHMPVNIVDDKFVHVRSNGKKTHFQVISQSLQDPENEFIFVDDEQSNLKSLSHVPNMTTVLAPHQYPNSIDQTGHYIFVAMLMGVTENEFKDALDKADFNPATKDLYLGYMQTALKQPKSNHYQPTYMYAKFSTFAEMATTSAELKPVSSTSSAPAPQNPLSQTLDWDDVEFDAVYTPLQQSKEAMSTCKTDLVAKRLLSGSEEKQKLSCSS